MCTIPPIPPPPPPPSAISNSPPKSCDSSPTFTYSDICQWATFEPQLWEVCAKNNICLNAAPFQYKYKCFESILQVGPTCGLVALSMLLNGEVTPHEMLNITKLEGYSNNGEMFSCKNMAKLAEKVVNLAKIENISFSVRHGGLFSEEIILELLNGAVLLVAAAFPISQTIRDKQANGCHVVENLHIGDSALPTLTETLSYYHKWTFIKSQDREEVYDADFNHAPCQRRGHTAHWALVCGIIIETDPGENYVSEPNNVYVLCRHGKSRYLTAWTLESLDKSNKNLMEFSPKKKDDGLFYVIPEGGIGGENGLRDQFLVFKEI